MYTPSQRRLVQSSFVVESSIAVCEVSVWKLTLLIVSVQQLGCWWQCSRAVPANCQLLSSLLFIFPDFSTNLPGADTRVTVLGTWTLGCFNGRQAGL